MYKKENETFIEKYGIPLRELMTSILEKKFESKLISEAQYERVERTLKSIFKSPIVDKDIEDIICEEIQRFVNEYKHLSDSSIKKNVHIKMNTLYSYLWA
ncbi:MAG: hypothetical protein ACI4ON_02125 [Clostridia bacterium]